MLKKTFAVFLCASLAYLAYSAAIGTASGSSERGSTASTIQAASQKDRDVHQVFVDECVQITPGKDSFPAEFQMGGLDEGPLAVASKTVSMTVPFRICRHEVTQELYRSVMRSNPSRWQGTRNSVEMVAFADAERFCELLTAVLKEKNLIDKNEIVRLPTEVEWEYCCRAGTKTRYSFGDSATSDGDKGSKATILDDYAWHTGNAAGNDPAVGVLKANPWGLYDMHGYLSEFVSDPASPVPNGDRIIRGGSWRNPHSQLTSTYRSSCPHDDATDAIGFRCVIAESTTKP